MGRRVDSIQEAHLEAPPPDVRDRLYWDELRRMMHGTAQLDGPELKALGLITLMRFGELEGDRRAIVGGALVAAPGGTIGWEADDGILRVAVRGYAPRLPRPLYALQSLVHVRLSRRYFARIAAGR